jgi:hypothetical protein
MMSARGDLNVVNEPFSGHYYYGPDRRNTRYPPEKPGPQHDPWHVRAQLLDRAAASPVFFKDMAYHVSSCMDADFLKPFRSALLIRDPRFSIPSLYRRVEDFTLEETGFVELHRLAGILREATGADPVVIDGETLRSDPGVVYRKYCEAVGIQFRPESLSWEPGEEPHWSKWTDWYQDAASSQGIRPPATKPDQETLAIPRVAEAVEHCRPYYESLAELAIRP